MVLQAAKLETTTPMWPPDKRKPFLYYLHLYYLHIIYTYIIYTYIIYTSMQYSKSQVPLDSNLIYLILIN